MDLLSAFKRKPPAPEAPKSADEVLLARTRARQRLIGAAILVVAGIIVFPLLFETQPRPIPVDLPIDIPRKDSVAPLVMPNASPEDASPGASAPVRPLESVDKVITETQADAGRETAPSTTAPASAPPVAADKPRAAALPVVEAASAGARAVVVPKESDGARALALLEGKPALAAASTASAPAGRYVVQVGSFTEPSAVKEARAKVEKTGLKTYTQVAETPAGVRTRVRVGPFASRIEAERAAAKIKAVALPTVILAL